MEAILQQTTVYSSHMAFAYARNLCAGVFFLAGFVLIVAGMRGPR